jgi:O-antigen/teichoic acid export membrane protein
MTEQQSSYRQIMKATSIFGGVQVFQIIIQVIRSKFVAILLGPAGMGIAGLLTSTLGFISAISNFGLSTSAVKNIAAANTTGNMNRLATVATVIQRVAWMSGILGAILTLTLSSWLSRLTFGNKDFTLIFVWLSITLLFNQLTSAQMVLLQGLRKLESLAKANLYGSIIGLAVTVPLYYKLGVNGIAPGIIITSLCTLCISWYFSKKIQIKSVKVSALRTVAESKNMLTIGFMISLSEIITLGAAYLIRIFIGRSGNVGDVGLYNAGFAIINTYVGMIFMAMGTDYYPRLSGVAQDNEMSKKVINQQAEIAMLILAPIIICFLVFIKWVIILLYSTMFIAVNNMIYWAALGMFFKATSWAVAMIFLARGTSKLFFWNELTGNLYFLILNLLGYYYFGLTGLGLAFLLGYILYVIQVYIIVRVNFKFSFDRNFILIFIVQFALAFFSLLVVRFLSQPYAYVFGIILILVSGFYSLKELDKRIGLIELLRNLKDNYFIKK